MYEDIHHLGHTEGVTEVVEWVVPVILLDPQQEPLEGGGVDVELLDQPELVVHLFEEREHLIWLPLPHIELGRLEGLLGLVGEDVLVVGWDVSLLRQQRLSRRARAVEMLGERHAGPESERKFEIKD